MSTPDTPQPVQAATTTSPGPAIPLAEVPSFFRLRAIMRQGTAASLPAVWERYGSVEAARGAVRGMYAEDHVLRVLIVTGDVPPQFVEWVER